MPDTPWADIASRKLSDVFREIIASKGQKVVAAEIDVDQPTISKFQAGTQGLTIEKLDKMIRLSDFVIVDKQTYNDIVRAGAVYASLLRGDVRFSQRSGNGQ